MQYFVVSMNFDLRMSVKPSTIISNLYDYMNYADVVLTCSDSDTNQKPVAHKLVLSNCSDFLKGLLEGNLGSHELIIPDICTNAMVRILQLIYTGEVRVDTEEQIAEIVEGIQLLGINSSVNTIQFDPKTCPSVVNDLEESQQIFPTSQLISPVSLEDYSYNSTDSNDTGGSHEIVPQGQGSSKDLVEVHQPILTNVQVKKQKMTKVNSLVQGPAPDTKKKVKRSAKRKMLPIWISGQGSSKGSRITAHQPNSIIELKTDFNGTNFLPDFSNGLNELAFLDGHELGNGYSLEFDDTGQMKALKEEEIRLQLTQDVALQDHSYTLKPIP